jgi:amino acid adenylation domain-containing protein
MPLAATTRTGSGDPASDQPNDFAPLHSGFLRSAHLFPDRPALEVSGATLTYAELKSRAVALAAALERATPEDGPPHTAFLAYRTPTAFQSVLAALLRGHAYVPLNPKFPPSRSRTMLERSEARALVVDEGSAAALEPILEGFSRRLLLVFPDELDADRARRRWPEHVVLAATDLTPQDDWAGPTVGPDATAYLMFTSGSTGQPKAVQVLHRNVRHFLDLMVDRWQINEHDRVSQTFDMTFDLSASDMFVAWERGACVCCPAAHEVVKPRSFIQRSELTVWYSVPSLGMLMKRLGMLKPSSYPSLRLSLFCGEALPLELAGAWASAAPESIVENVYGPTEVTISTATYRFDPVRTPPECEHGIVPIGEPHPGMEAIVVDGELHEVAPGAEGELLICGPQVTAGYWRDPEKTAAAFVRLEGRDGLYYRTGDRVRRPRAEGDPIRYLGRVDHQVKISGYRVELGEVEATLREATGIDEVVAVAWPKTEAGYGGIVAFVRASQVDAAAIRHRMSERLPDYMVPRVVRTLDEIPLNVNGKFDRPALIQLLSQSS